MFSIYPQIKLRHITHITPALLEKLGIKGLLVDIDNTITHHNSQEIDRDILVWLEKIKDYCPLVLLSNNGTKRVKPFAERLNLPFVANGAKPLPSVGLTKGRKMLGLPFSDIGVVGDQIFTDILGGNLAGATTIWVKPLGEEVYFFLRLKRHSQNWLLRRHSRKKRL